MGPAPSNVIMLTADAFGVLPPIAKLTPEQAMYYFLSGYTAKVAGTEIGVTEPEATYSTCFGAPFMRSEEHTSELQSLMRISYAVFCLKKNIQRNTQSLLYIHSRPTTRSHKKPNKIDNTK